MTGLTLHLHQNIQNVLIVIYKRAKVCSIFPLHFIKKFQIKDMNLVEIYILCHVPMFHMRSLFENTDKLTFMFHVKFSLYWAKTNQNQVHLTFSVDSIIPNFIRIY